MKSGDRIAVLFLICLVSLQVAQAAPLQLAKRQAPGTCCCNTPGSSRRGTTSGGQDFCIPDILVEDCFAVGGTCDDPNVTPAPPTPSPTEFTHSPETCCCQPSFGGACFPGLPTDVCAKAKGTCIGAPTAAPTPAPTTEETCCCIPNGGTPDQCLPNVPLSVCFKATGTCVGAPTGTPTAVPTAPPTPSATDKCCCFSLFSPDVCTPGIPVSLCNKGQGICDEPRCCCFPPDAQPGDNCLPDVTVTACELVSAGTCRAGTQAPTSVPTPVPTTGQCCCYAFPTDLIDNCLPATDPNICVVVSNGYCESPDCTGVSGGTLSTSDSTSITIGTGSGTVNVVVSAAKFRESRIIVTNDAGLVLFMPTSNAVHFDGSFVGDAYIWNLAYTGDLVVSVGTTVDPANPGGLASGCASLSNGLPVTVAYPATCCCLQTPADPLDNCLPATPTTVCLVASNSICDFPVCIGLHAATISTNDATSVTTGDGIPDIVNVLVSGSIAQASQLIVTDSTGVVLSLPTGTSQDFDGAGSGTCLIWHMGYTGTLSIGVGSNINSATLATGCSVLSNSIEITRTLVGGATFNNFAVGYAGSTRVFFPNPAFPNEVPCSNAANQVGAAVGDCQLLDLGLPVVINFACSEAGTSAFIVATMGSTCGAIQSEADNQFGFGFVTTSVLGQCVQLPNLPAPVFVKVECVPRVPPTASPTAPPVGVPTAQPTPVPTPAGQVPTVAPPTVPPTIPPTPPPTNAPTPSPTKAPTTVSAPTSVVCPTPLTGTTVRVIDSSKGDTIPGVPANCFTGPPFTFTTIPPLIPPERPTDPLKICQVYARFPSGWNFVAASFEPSEEFKTAGGPLYSNVGATFDENLVPDTLSKQLYPYTTCATYATVGDPFHANPDALPTSSCPQLAPNPTTNFGAGQFGASWFCVAEDSPNAFPFDCEIMLFQAAVYASGPNAATGPVTGTLTLFANDGSTDANKRTFPISCF